MDIKETRTILDEYKFTNLCKMGLISHGSGYTRTDVYLTKSDMLLLVSGEILTKEENDQVFKYALQDIGKDLIREILKRSPLYSEMYYEI